MSLVKFTDKIMKFCKFRALVFALFVVLFISGCKILGFNNPEKKARKQQEKETKKADKAHQKDVNRHYKMQTKDTQRRMKKNKKSAKKKNRSKKNKSKWRCS